MASEQFKAAIRNEPLQEPRASAPTHSPTTYSDAELGEKQIGFGGALVFCNGASDAHSTGRSLLASMCRR